MLTAIDNETQTLTPEVDEDEDQVAFAIRFHNSMADQITNTREREQACQDAWQRSNDDARGDDARAEFSGEQYHTLPGLVVHFKEHKATNRDGTTTDYGPEELGAMVRNMNRRIDDTGNYAILSAGHTSDDPDADEPDVLGYAGPFILGMFGQDKPLWCILGMEHHFSDSMDTARRLPTRSAEVWLDPDPTQLLISPIAGLGSAPPRLDLGMVRYSRSRLSDGVLVERYSSDASAVTGACSAAVTRERYEDDGDDSMDGEQGIVEQVVAAVLGSLGPQLDWIDQQMAGAPMDPTNPEPEPAVDAEPIDEPEPVAEPVEEYEAASEPAPPADPEPAPETAADSEDPAVELARLRAENRALKEQLSQVSGQNREQYRRSTLQGYREKGFAVHVDEELQGTADLDDQQFERYAKTIENRVRVPLSGQVTVPDGQAPQAPQQLSSTERERYAREARKEFSRQKAAGGDPDYRAIHRQILEQNQQQV